MGLFDKIKQPIILKEDSSAHKHLSELELLLPGVTDPKLRQTIENDIAAVKAGILGEETILYELKNSHIPMFVLHDLYLEHGGLSAQIDFLIVTRRRNFVVECKNLYGDITINNAGDFVRTAWRKQEGIYSPVTQCARHLELIKQIRSDERNNVLTKAMFEHYFYENYRSVVVLANPKTVLNAKFAPKEIKKQVIRADQLIAFIKKVNDEKDAENCFEADMEKLAQFFLNLHRECPTDYTEKYRRLIQAAQEETKPEKPQNHAAPNASAEVPACPACGAPMVRRRATRGANAGSEFWGCSKYPQCRGIVNIS